jgi:flagellar biosynthesis/type III secretory pathway protein FliH
MTGAEQLIEMGKKEGMQQGELNGERMVLRRQLLKRFGSIPSNYIEKLDNASQEILLEWIDNVIEAKTLDDVFETRH